MHISTPSNLEVVYICIPMWSNLEVVYICIPMWSNLEVLYIVYQCGSIHMYTNVG
jgi:hypothetical protein